MILSGIVEGIEAGQQMSSISGAEYFPPTVLLILFFQYGRRSGSYMFTLALHCFVVAQGPAILYAILRVQRSAFFCDRDAR